MNATIRRTLVVILLVILQTVPVASSHGAAAESSLKPVLTDAVYGGIIGSLIGAAALVFTEKPGDHLEFVPVGAAIGVLGGTAFGVGRALMEVDRGRVRFSLPTVIPEISEKSSGTSITFVASLIQGKF
jgi:hypothetical protein